MVYHNDRLKERVGLHVHGGYEIVVWRRRSFSGAKMKVWTGFRVSYVHRGSRTEKSEWKYQLTLLIELRYDRILARVFEA